IYYPSIPLYLSGNFLILLIFLSVMVKLVSDWHYNLYIVTTRKILKVSCSPLFSQTISEVLLDQVRVIEVNVKIKNFVHVLLDMGDVVIVFDRPSHEEMFVIANIEDPGATGDFLTHAFELIMHSSPVWFHPRDTKHLYKLTEDVYERPHTES
ncbi:hypothetical protein HYT33_01755, partial [Candidatus Roizmanbacteria bacterium]|nr:hypothetical protein [Candidatus Roizmanbacteria bacterium]